MKKYLFICLAAVSAVAAGCNRSERFPAGNHDGSLKIFIRGELPGVRAASSVTVAENTVYNYTALVYSYATGKLEDYRQITGAGEAVFTGLSTAGAKRIVIIANANPLLPAFTAGTSLYNELGNATFTLDAQDPATAASGGLIMTGEYSGAYVLPAGGGSVTVNVTKAVAKVVLGTVSVTGDDYAKFKLTGVSIQRALSTSDFATPPDIYGDFWGGATGNETAAVKTYLFDAVTLGDSYAQNDVVTFDNFFYVLPNPGPATDCTLLTLHATYEYVAGTPTVIYFPLRVNYQTNGTTGDTTDGTFIKRNMIYTVNVVIENPSEGEEDPDTPADKANLTVEVVPADWSGTIVQNETI